MNLELIVNSTALLYSVHGYAAAGTPQEKETLDSSLVARTQWRWSRSLAAHRYTHTEAEQLQAAAVGTHHCTVLQGAGLGQDTESCTVIPHHLHHGPTLHRAEHALLCSGEVGST